MKRNLITVLIILSFPGVFAQKAVVISPGKKIIVQVHNRQNSDKGEWYLKVSYNNNNGTTIEAIPDITPGLSGSDQDYRNDLKLIKTGKISMSQSNIRPCTGREAFAANPQMRW
ncbi:MAG: hypothetical protein GYA43_07170 [Bacteroidales bacterium]|nr:hypothetical protein [Bacteroidales bacterium]